jgi:hypothetical protein
MDPLFTATLAPSELERPGNIVPFLLGQKICKVRVKKGGAIWPTFTL